MSESSSRYDLDDDIAVQQAHDGEWAWVDEAYDGAGTRVVEWIEIVDLTEVEVDRDGVRHLQLNDADATGAGRRLSETRWLQSSHWVDVEEMR